MGWREEEHNRLIEHAREQVVLCADFDEIETLEEEEFVTEWVGDNIDNYYDCDCDQDGYFECTNYGAMIEAALEKFREMKV